MKAKNWNGGWLECAFSKTEAAALMRLLGYLDGDDALMQRLGHRRLNGNVSVPIGSPGGPPDEDEIVDKAIHEMAVMFKRVVNARTKLSKDFTEQE